MTGQGQEEKLGIRERRSILQVLCLKTAQKQGKCSLKNQQALLRWPEGEMVKHPFAQDT